MNGPEAVMAAGIWSQESENQGGENKNSRSWVNRIGLEQVLLWSLWWASWAQWEGMSAKFKGPGQIPVFRNLDSAWEPFIIAMAGPEMVWVQFALSLELVDQADSMGRGRQCWR